MAYNYELGSNVQIFFGKVHDQHDTETKGNFTGLGICRCQIIIPGITDEVDADLLPWYFPWYGRKYLPEVGDTVAVLIFDGNFATGFYGPKIDLEDENLDPNDYNNYLELFKRNCDGNDVQLTYKTSKGIEIFNGTEDGSKGSKLHLELELFTVYCEANFIKVSKDLINVGNASSGRGEQWSTNGENTHDLLKTMIASINTLHNDVKTLMQAIQNGCNNPYTIGIKAGILANLPKYISDITSTKSQHDSKSTTDLILSQMVKITM